MQEIGGYRLERQLGAGGMGTVWLAHDADDRRVAFKLLHPHISRDPSARARLRREVDLLHRVRGPGVAQVMDAEVDDDEAFVVTELIEGPTLYEDLEREGPFNERELAGLGIGLAEALRAIHRVGVIHRDLKPGNVMMSPTGPVIIDFGISQIADDTRLTQTGMVTGTPGYLDPEIINGGDVSETCDWWSWAAVLAFAATGRMPFGTGPALTIIKRMDDHVVDLEGVDALIAKALRAALHPESARRLDPDSVLAVLDGQWGESELDQALAERDVHIRPAEAPILPPRDGATGILSDATDLMPGSTAVFPESAPPMPAGLPGGPPAQAASPAPGAVLQQRWADAPQQPGTPEHGWLSAPPPLQPPAWSLPGRPVRTVVFVLGALCVSTAALYPIWSAAALIGVSLVSATWGRAAFERRRRTSLHGKRRGDGARTAALVPWHLVLSILIALIPVGIAVAMGVGLIYLSGSYTLPAAPTLWCGAAVLALLMWFGPGSQYARAGARIAVRELFPIRPLRVAVVLLAVVGIAVVGIVVLNYHPPEWGPLEQYAPELAVWPNY